MRERLSRFGVRVTALTAALLMTAGGLSGCAGAAEPAVLRIAIPATDAQAELSGSSTSDSAAAGVLADLLAEYDADHDELQLVVSQLAADAIIAQLNRTLGRPDAPDVAVIDGDSLQLLEPYADLLAQVEKNTREQWPEWVQSAATSAGRQVGYPLGVEPRALCFRTQAFEDAGLESDRGSVATLLDGEWSQFLATGARIAEATGAPFLDSMVETYESMVDQLASPYERASTGAVTATSSRGVRTAFDLVTGQQELFADVEPLTDQWLDAAAAGGFAASLCTPATAAALAGVDGWDVADVTPTAGSNAAIIAMVVVPSTGGQLSAATELAKWLAADEQQAVLSAADGSIPSTTSTGAQATFSATDALDADITADIFRSRFAAVEKYAWHGSQWREIDDAMRAALASVAAGTTPESAWSTWVAAVPEA